jgi:glycosyltransferase involved in cell wall biosynthesis
MEGYPKTSLVISTYNWPEALNLCLKSVRSQHILPDEVIIADDGSTKTTQILIENLKKDFPVPIIHVWHEDIGFRKSLIINKSVKRATGDYLIFTDGDIILHPCFVKDHLHFIRKDFFVQGSRGLITNTKTEKIIQTGDIKLNFFSSGIQHRENIIRCKLLSFLIKADPTSSEHIIGCNYAFWKNDFIGANGFNNDIQGWGHEDIEYAARLINNGVKRKKIKFQAICFHLHHKFLSRDKVNKNMEMYKKTVTDMMKRCENGYDQV